MAAAAIAMPMARHVVVSPALRARRGLRSAPAWALLLASASGLARADTLIAPSGERITGRLVSQAQGLVVFDSASFGRIQVRADSVRVEASPVAEPSGAARAPVPASAWTADLSAKLGVDRGSLKSPEDDIDATLRLVRSTPRGELHTTVTYNYKRSGGELKDDDLFASLSYDRLLPARRFVAWRALESTDLTAQGHDSTQSVSAAYGWRLWEGKDRYLRIGPAIGYLVMDRAEQHFDGAALGLYARAKGPLWGKVNFSTELQWLDSLDDGRYANLELRLRHPLGERLYLALVWNYVWSDVNIETGFTSEWQWVLGWQSKPQAQ